MADQKVERDLPAELQIFFHPPSWILDEISLQKHHKAHFWVNFRNSLLREYSIELSKFASPDFLGSTGPHRVAKSVGNKFQPKFRQHFQK